ncbi:MAG: efflux RND transporter periplasmic adaptor subunit [Acidobacteria bacterium]|nr:efflux RND transporter periplasmic adaptor subunit [Acidobacteriota bacterium]
MRKVLLLAVIAAAFLGGYFFRSARQVAAQARAKAARKILYYVDPMHPAYKSDKPGIAPDCGMKLEPVYADQAPADELETVHADDAAAFPGAVRISTEKQQLIGVRYGKVEVAGGTRVIRAEGKVAYDETRIAHIHTKVDGWIDKVFVDFTGQLVKKGQPLLTIYSPEMLASQNELLLASKARDIMKGNPLESALDSSESLLRAARRRLQLWDISDAQIDEVLKTGQPIKNITLYSTISGYVTGRKAFANQKVTPELDLYTIADLGRAWIIADVFENEAASVHVGQQARVSLSYDSGKSFTATVSYIQPEVDPVTRTLKVRLNVDNPGYVLKPDMYVNVEFRDSVPPSLTAPAEAVLDGGERKTVFVARGNGFFEPRRVETGETNGGRITILKGLKAGETIVTSGNFLIDSESQLKAAASGMTHD